MSLLSILFYGVLTPSAHAQNIIHVPADQPTIQAGINTAQNGDTVLVAPGTYYENINFKGKAITVTSSGGAAITIIDGGGIAPTVMFVGQESRASVLSNLTIRNGGPTPGTVGDAIWGGIFTSNNSNPTILNNLITQNTCNGYFGSGGALLQGNTISGTLLPTTASCSIGGSAGVFLYDVAPAPAQVVGNTIENNLQPTQVPAGALYIDSGGGSIVENNMIRNNAMTGIYMTNTNSIVIAQNLVYGNTSTDTAGGMYALVPFTNLGPPVGIIENNTFTQNTGTPSQVYLDGDLQQFDFVNNIVAGNGSSAAFLCGYPPKDGLSLTPLVIDHNDIYNASGAAYGDGCPDQTGTYGNLSTDPRFTNPATFNFHLGAGSPVIDAGNNSLNSVAYQLGQSLTDLDGNPRLQDATGVGYPIIDMGAYEVQSLSDANPTNLVIIPSSYQVPAGTPITLIATLYSPNGPPLGAVTFFEDGNFLGTSVQEILPLPPVQAISDLDVPSLTPGIHAFVGTYLGQSPFTPATSVKIFVLADSYRPTLTLTSAPNPSAPNQAVTFTATLTSPDGITGPVTLMANGIPLTGSPGTSPGTTVFTTSFTTAGTFTVIASYAGDATHNSATASITQQVIVSLASTATLTASPTTAYAGQPVTLNAAITGSVAVPSGTVTFSETVPGSGLIVVDGTAPLDAIGHAVLNTSTLSVGTHIITALYGGDATYSSSHSSSVTITILANPQDFTFALPNPTLTVKTGQFATTTAVLTSLNGFTDTIVVNCPVLPAHLYCVGNPFPIQTPLSANGAVNVAITISTTPLPAVASAATAPLMLAALLSPFSLLAGVLAFRRRTPLRLLLLLLAILPAALSLTGCGEVTVPYNPPAAPGTYIIPITATGVATGITHSVQLTLIVTP